MNDFNGRWEPTKRPIAWEYTIGFTCGVCGSRGGTVGTVDEGATPNIADWRIIPALVGHDNPLAKATVVCSRDCAETHFREYLDGLYS